MAHDARTTAYDVLRAVHGQGAYANLVLPRLVGERPLSERDRALVAELAYGTLRAEGQLDHVLALCVTRGLDAVEPAVLDVLRLGAYQLLRTRVPPHAAVAESVELARRVVGERSVGFVNAVLRKVSSRGGDLAEPDFATDPIGHLSVRTAHPQWIAEAFHAATDGDLDETAAALSADDVRPEVHLVARPGRLSRAELLAECVAAGLAATAGAWSPYAVRLGGGDPGRLASVRNADAGVQDEGSQLCAIAAARLLDTGAPPAPTVVDLCAGPGGKLALLAALRPDATYVGLELHPHRARLVTQAAGGSATVVIADSTEAPVRDASADLVLLDAPCTGLGALRRRPEARWRKQPEDVPRLVELQRALLASAQRLLRPGGALLYVVCSPHLAETRDQVSWAEAQGLVAVPTVALLPELGADDGRPWLQLWTHRHGTDAMFLAAFRRL